MHQNKKDYAYGCIIFNDIQNPTHVVLVHHASGHIAFPKGHKEGDEDTIIAMRREVKEETGITDVVLVDAEPLVERYSFKTDGIKYEKEVLFWIGSAPMHDTELQPELPDVVRAWWCSLADVAKTLTYTESYALYNKSLDIIQHHL
ncbi:MAG: NUDIX domain-containing protein [Candidatus Pacebacteria bacterium]|nr:NUDIX domain-containing protein [Candidatus Paceibacterota bacterium]